MGESGQYFQLEDFTEPKLGSHGDGSPSPFPTHFKPNRQTWNLLKGQVSRLSFTLILDILYVVSLKVYQDAGTVRHSNKHAFNVITTGLSLALGLNFLEAFKDMAKVLRWRVLANRSFSIREADLILGSESLMKILEFMGESMRKPLTLFICTCWIAVNLLAQVSVATISLTYSMDKGFNSSGIVTHNGTVQAAQLNFSDGKIPLDSLQSITHAFGETTLSWNNCSYKTDDDIKKAPQDCTYFTNSSGSEFAFRFVELNVDTSSSAYPYRTDRIVKASPGHCYEYSVAQDKISEADSPDGIKGVLVYPFYNETYNGTLPIPKPSAAHDATTYVWNGTEVPQNATAQLCGPRCVWLYAFRSIGDITTRPDTIFQCPITLSVVSGSTQEAHNISDENARLMAASIALSGRYTNPNGPRKVWRQYQLYMWENYWETEGLNAQEVGARMAEFAMGSLASAALLSDLIQIPGTVPTLGYNLNVEWQYVIPLAAVVAGVHAVVVGLTLWVSRPVIVGGDSNLAVAKLLQKVVEPLKDKGSLLDAKGLAEALQREEQGHGKKIAYGVRSTGENDEGSWVLEVSEDVNIRKTLPGGRFPTASYT